MRKGSRAELFKRLIGIQANSSSLDHTELDGAAVLHQDDLQHWGENMLRLNERFGIKILGGCCGTDNTYLQYLVDHRKIPKQLFLLIDSLPAGSGYLSAMGLTAIQTPVMGGQKILQRNFLLLEKTSVRQSTAGNHLNHRTNRSGGRPGNRPPLLSCNLNWIILSDKFFTIETAGQPTLHRGMDIDHILAHRRLGVDQDPAGIALSSRISSSCRKKFIRAA